MADCVAIGSAGFQFDDDGCSIPVLGGDIDPARCDGLFPVAIDDGLAELDFGYLEGQVITDTMKAHNLKMVQDLITVLPPETEPWPALAKRGLRCVASWLDAHPQASILFVSHDGVMQAMFEALSGKWFHNRHGIPVRYAPTEKGWIVEEI